jgi:hypothetical protein
MTLKMERFEGVPVELEFFRTRRNCRVKGTVTAP